MNVTKVVVEQIFEKLSLSEADIRLAQFCDAADAADWFRRLHGEIVWERHRLNMFGREIDAPRLSSWIGDADAVYAYSRKTFVPQAWTPALLEIRDWLQALTSATFNSVLCNLYRDGNDAMGWHSDDEPELGAESVIASLSFGAVRKFRLRHRSDASRRLDIDLPSGSVLLMAGSTQENYRHDLPRSKRITAPRINLTFRKIFPRVTL